jgi:hypothetical protein
MGGRELSVCLTRMLLAEALRKSRPSSQQPAPELSQNFSGCFADLFNQCVPSTKMPGYCQSSRFAGLYSGFLRKVDGRAEGLRILKELCNQHGRTGVYIQ